MSSYLEPQKDQYDMADHAILEPLIRRRVFADEKTALRELTRDYIRHQIETLIRQVRKYEQRYGMSFDRFGEYLHARSTLLNSDELSAEQKRNLGQAIMHEEDDGLDWKASLEMLDSWLSSSRQLVPDSSAPLAPQAILRYASLRKEQMSAGSPRDTD